MGELAVGAALATAVIVAVPVTGRRDEGVARSALPPVRVTEIAVTAGLGRDAGRMGVTAGLATALTGLVLVTVFVGAFVTATGDAFLAACAGTFFAADVVDPGRVAGFGWAADLA